MDALKRLTALPAHQLASIVIAVLAVAGFMIGAYSWIQTPDYRPLFTNLSDTDSGAVLQALGTMNVPYKISEGSAIMVPSGAIHETRFRLAQLNLPKGSASGGYELLDNIKFGATQSQEQISMQRAKEGEIAKSIQSIAAVQKARVHILCFLRSEET